MSYGLKDVRPRSVTLPRLDFISSRKPTGELRGTPCFGNLLVLEGSPRSYADEELHLLLRLSDNMNVVKTSLRREGRDFLGSGPFAHVEKRDNGWRYKPPMSGKPFCFAPSLVVVLTAFYLDSLCTDTTWVCEMGDKPKPVSVTEQRRLLKDLELVVAAPTLAEVEELLPLCAFADLVSA